MGKKTVRLRFTEDDLADDAVRKAAQKAEKAAEKADRAKDKLPTKRLKQTEPEKLRFGKKKIEADSAKSTRKRRQRRPDASPEKQPAAASQPGAKEQTASTSTPRSAPTATRAETPPKAGISSAAKGAPKTASKLRAEPTSAGAMRSLLKFDEGGEKIAAPKRGRTLQRMEGAVSAGIHRQVSKDNADENVGVQAADESSAAAEGAAHAVDHHRYSRKLKAYRKAERLEAKADKANVEALHQKAIQDDPAAASNPISRWRQKQELKKRYAAAKAAQSAGVSSGASSSATGASEKAASGAKSIVDKAAEYIREHPKGLILALLLAALVLFLSSAFTSCSVFLNGGGNVILGTSYTASDEDILGADADYTALETALRNEINNVESTHPGYDEYRYNLVEIGHNPYELASYLTVLFEDYTREEVQSTLQSIFDRQYTLTLTEEVELRTRTVTNADGEESEEEYEYYILNVTLTNSGIGAVVRFAGLTDDQTERYDLLMETHGNRSDLFGDDVFAVAGGEYTDYDIPGEALTDERFANMIREAEKYLGYPYVWGGSSPSTSFDCSGFVSWVINNCGNGWSVGRLTANGLMGVCDIIPASEAQPGDLIFFQGTYNTSGASHVGIYVGNSMMFHCGNPISYANISSSYWQEHFYCFGRIRG